jgi:hypothetical protein
VEFGPENLMWVKKDAESNRFSKFDLSPDNLNPIQLYYFFAAKTGQ